ncbi:amidohydrolase [Pseudokineococcus sp. 1T1Z-3]|uniref:amidohydrolase n=1 Tax=Pseudokineococcus sp. 1T1Z-3 TaxID=3132745 RepID=UPI0030B0D10A
MSLLLHRVRLVGAPDPGRVRDVLLEEGRVAAVVDSGDGPWGAAAEVVDADGAWLLPGLRDEHVHLGQWASAQHRVDLSAASSAAEAAALLAGLPAALDPGDVLLAGGFRDGMWPAPPHRDQLDAALPGRLVVAASADLHTVWCSTPAAQRLGLRDPSGLAREAEAMEVLARAGALDPDLLDARVLAATAAAAARGVTSVLDLEHAPLADWGRRAALPLPPGAAVGADDVPGPAVRVGAGVQVGWLDDVLAAGLRTGDPVPGASPWTAQHPVSRDRVRVGPLKVFLDGSLGARTARCDDAYPDGTHGLLLLPAAELEQLLRRATVAGLHVAVHAIGDAAVGVALDAFEAVGCRGRVEHAQQVRARDLPRFAALGVVASVQPRHALDDRDLADRYWAHGAARSFPTGALHAAGAGLVLGSDAPVAPLDPWETLASAVHRSGDERAAWHAEHHLTLREALTASCGGRAFVRVGDVADLALLAEEPAEVLATRGPDGLRGIPVLGTLVGGLWTHRDAAVVAERPPVPGEPAGPV